MPFRGFLMAPIVNSVASDLVKMQRRALKHRSIIRFSQTDVRRQGKMLTIAGVANKIQQLQDQAQLTPDVCKATLGALIADPAIKNSFHITRECRRLIKEIDRLEADKAHHIGAQGAPQPQAEAAIRIGV